MLLSREVEEEELLSPDHKRPKRRTNDKLRLIYYTYYIAVVISTFLLLGKHNTHIRFFSVLNMRRARRRSSLQHSSHITGVYARVAAKCPLPLVFYSLQLPSFCFLRSKPKAEVEAEKPTELLSSLLLLAFPLSNGRELVKHCLTRSTTTKAPVVADPPRVVAEQRCFQIYPIKIRSLLLRCCHRTQC